MAYPRRDKFAIPEGATILGRLLKEKKVSTENFQQELKSGRCTYEDCCLKADLTVALGTNKLRSILYEGYYCLLFNKF